jgi:two-component system, sensor histidine kinase and response regulator
MTVRTDEILVVEDSPTQRKRLVHILEDGGYRVATAADGREALALLAERRPALVISDVMMPGMDGYTLCRTIKEDPELCPVPVILVTYLSDTLDVVRGLEAGADNFVMKPYERDFLLARIRRTLGATPATDECSTPFPLEMEEREIRIRSGRRQMVEILLSSYETALQRNERLKEAQDELRFANQELEAFSYSVSHDLRTPLSVIAGFAELLWLDYEALYDERGRKHLEMIRQSAAKMERLIDDLLKLSQVTRTELKQESFDLSAMVRAIAAEMEKMNPGRKVDFEIEEGMTITGDPTLLQIAFENLLGNAWKFTSKKEKARIEVGCKPQTPPVYYVQDNGAGFDMREHDKLFASFQRLHSESEFPGTGIGLVIVGRIIARHGGRIWAEGRVNEGALFCITLRN